MNKHTPGPWTVLTRPTPETGEEIFVRMGSLAIRMSILSEITQQKVDANLIAAAPELLEALVRTRDDLNNAKFLIRGELGKHPWLYGIQKGMDIADAAIAKARGAL